ncbi:small RNA 2'-O-methyltransferase [Alligator mississippiensis]|uniref:Small RNA 2'-O-methyltransferase n=1 Tax=Alligator mississippiensis TaxID=8496 RepID=A0A151M3Z7_ALLMI|nr:small RNA 2'-O-methyltransferase [Alligator mississippiensis]XP_019334904.1 small RNA 2'-O-methyltransferase [Alligator mississippiensis]KYO19249.1 small RNA 2'-O-methyltransferase [Alligator mississippiensis]
MVDANLAKGECTGTIKFTPPLYKQRYQFIKDLVNKYKPKKVADLGCADCSLLWMLKFCKCIEVLAGLDICENVMKEKMHRLSPLPGDYLQPSERTLIVTLYHGSVAQKDPCMLGFDLITCIELIEHLEATELEKFPEVVFGFMAPAMVVISTPNSEFNPLLPGVTLFRHPDHKFEWDQAQFQSWALDAASCYDYTVEFTGLGAPPPGTEDVGFCTQIAVFRRKYPNTGEPINLEKPTENSYRTIFKAVYPSLKDEKYLQNAVVSEVINTAQIITRRLLDSFNSVYKEHSDGLVEMKPDFQLPHYFMRHLKNPSLAEAEKLADDRNMETYVSGNAVYIPLIKIFSIPKVNKLCGTFENLSKLITGKVALSNDGSAVVISTEHEHEEKENE